MCLFNICVRIYNLILIMYIVVRYYCFKINYNEVGELDGVRARMAVRATNLCLRGSMAWMMEQASIPHFT